MVFICGVKLGLAQDYHKFRFNVGVGTTAQSNFSVYCFEPSLRIHKKIILGVRFELHNIPDDEQRLSYTLTGQYYFPATHVMGKKLQFFAGLGAGIYSVANRSIVISYSPSGQLHTYREGIDGSRGGFYPRLGFEINRLTFAFEYNLIYRREVSTSYFLYGSSGLQTWSTPYVFNSANYAAFKIGYFFGGGVNKNPKIVKYDGRNFHKIRLGLVLGYADLHTNDGRSPTDAVVLYAEPSYRIRNDIAIGFRLELISNSTYKATSQGFTGQYYFSNRNFRPFAGVGLSLFQSRFSESDYSTYYKYYSSNEQVAIGIYPRIGFDAGHFSCTIDWNFISPARATINNQYILTGVNQSYEGQINSSYLSIKGGVFIGGGRKKIIRQ